MPKKSKEVMTAEQWDEYLTDLPRRQFEARQAAEAEKRKAHAALYWELVANIDKLDRQKKMDKDSGHLSETQCQKDNVQLRQRFGGGMKCPKCNSAKSKVNDSRDHCDSIKRRRECLQCGFRFNTIETVEMKSVITKPLHPNLPPIMNAGRNFRVKRFLREDTMDDILDESIGDLQHGSIKCHKLG